MSITGGIMAGVGAATSLAGSAMSSNAATSAAQTQAQADEYAANLQNQTTQQVLGYAAPYREGGTTALQYLSQGTAPGGQFNSNPTASQVMAQDPGYQFNLQQGQLGLERAEAAGGGVGSGGALMAGAQYANNYATNSYQDAYNRFMENRQSNYSNLANLASIGENATVLSGNTAMQGTAAANNLLTSGAAATAGGIVGSANAWNQGFGGVANSTNSLLNLNAMANLSNQSGYGGAYATNPGVLNAFTPGQDPSYGVAATVPGAAQAPPVYNGDLMYG